MSQKDNSVYSQRGASASKEEVHNAIKNIDKGLYPNAFCKIIPDYLSGDKDSCLIMHADGAGTKSALAYAYWKETGDLSVWKGIAQDAVVMNLDDLICVGAVDNILLSSTIGRNKHIIPGEVISAIIGGTEEFLEKMRGLGVNIISTGGETADLGDVVRTVIVDSTVTARLKRSDVLENKIRVGDVIVGFASFGKAVYEDSYNGGIGSNGLTSARHDLFGRSMLKHKETINPYTKEELNYIGKYSLRDSVLEQSIEINTHKYSFVDDKYYDDMVSLDMGKLLLSPTRTYAPIMAEIFRQGLKSGISGIIHCSGGALTKVLHFASGVEIVKNELFEIPPLFKFIKDSAKSSLQEMFKVFNMGHRMEIYLDPSIAGDVIKIAESFGVEAKIIGEVRSLSKDDSVHKAKCTITYGGDYFEYYQ